MADAATAPPAARTALAHCVGDRFLVWGIEDIVWLRSQCRLAVTPVGACSARVATRGKAAAVPVLLSDEDVCTALGAGWLRVVGEGGRPMGAEEAMRRSLHSISPSPSPPSPSALSSAPSPAAAAAMSPAVVHQLLRRAVHADLTAKGYATTNGLKFGVDFLAYRGDPTAVHAAFMVIVGPEGSGLAALDLVARSRVSTTALKIAVMAWATVPGVTDGGRAGHGGGAGGAIGAGAGAGQQQATSVRYAAFKRMGPGTAIFADSSAQRAGLIAHAQQQQQAASMQQFHQLHSSHLLNQQQQQQQQQQEPEMGDGGSGGRRGDDEEGEEGAGAGAGAGAGEGAGRRIAATHGDGGEGGGGGVGGFVPHPHALSLAAPSHHPAGH